MGDRGTGDDVTDVADTLRPIYGSLRRFAAVVAPIELDPDDVLQEAIARVLHTRRWQDLGNPEAYLRRTMMNLVANERRRLGRQKRAFSRGVSDPTTAPAYPSDLDDLERLDPASRALLYLVEIDGATIAEAAEIVGCSPVGARARLSRARRRLRLELEEEARRD